MRNAMERKACYVCGKENLSKNEIGLTKKLFDRNANYYFCLDCLAEQLEVDTEFLLERLEEFKSQGCIFF
jgi:predicted nucleic-acid-binding Zn-ribbon protein